jgi:hypothetical protein
VNGTKIANDADDLQQHVGNCESCIYWRREAPASPMGFCKRNPPMPVLIAAPPPAAALMRPGQHAAPQVQLQSLWPPTPVGEWCGEYDDGAVDFDA